MQNNIVNIVYKTKKTVYNGYNKENNVEVKQMKYIVYDRGGHVVAYTYTRAAALEWVSSNPGYYARTNNN